MKSQQIILISLITLLTCSVTNSQARSQEQSSREEGQIYKPQIKQFLSPKLLAQTSIETKAQADTLLRQGINQHKNGEFRAALKSTQVALTLYQDIKDDRGIADALGIIGNTYFSLGRYQQATEFYQQQLEIVRNLGDRAGEAQSLTNLSNSYFYLADYERARKLQQQAQIAKQRFGNPIGETAFLGNTGIVSEREKQYMQALDLYHQQLSRARKLGDKANEANILNHLGQAAVAAEKYEVAIQFYQQQLEMARNLGDKPGVANSLKRVAEAYNFLRQYQQAIDFYQQQLVVSREIRDAAGEANSLKALVAAYKSLGQPEKAVELYQQQADLAIKSSDRLSLGTALNNIALTHISNQNYPEAKKVLLDGINVWESKPADSNDKALIIKEQSNTYGLLQQVLITQNQPEDALEIAEQQRTKYFKDLFTKTVAPSIVQLPLEAPKLAQIQKIAAQQKATIIEYSIIKDSNQKDSELFVWAIQPTGKVVVRRIDLQSKDGIAPLSTIEELVASSREALGAAGDRGIVAKSTAVATPEAKLRQLHKLLIDPIAEFLPKEPEARVIFIPQGALFLVPFAALQDESGKYLIEKHTILTAPGIQVLELSRKQREKSKGDKVLVMGNPIIPNIPSKMGEPPTQLAPISTAEQEILEVSRLWNTKPLTGNAATKVAMLEQLPKAKIIHLATQGILKEIRDGVPGAIALSPARSDNGLLTANEILNLKLRAKLVVISAGEVGKGKIGGDGVIGLSTSLISAGVPSAILSLWTVTDAPTASLMTEFYRNFRRNDDKAKALRQAMLTTMKQHPAPKDWAAFTLIGEAK